MRQGLYCKLVPCVFLVGRLASRAWTVTSLALFPGVLAPTETAGPNLDTLKGLAGSPT